MIRNYKMVLSYDGTDYHGWQIQPRKKTIQGTLEAALSGFRSGRVPVIGAGRTDAGVHALGQTAGFHADLALSDAELLRALNGQLPGDIRIRSVEQVPEDFHARKSARSKIYRYRIITSPWISPFAMRYALHWPSPLDIDKMRTAASLFQRKADFSAFSSNRLLRPVRTVMRSEIGAADDEVVYIVEADGFLKYMVRTMVGTLLEVGRGRLEPEALERLFAGRTRSLASPSAPAKGLCLWQVKY